MICQRTQRLARIIVDDLERLIEGNRGPLRRLAGRGTAHVVTALLAASPWFLWLCASFTSHVTALTLVAGAVRTLPAPGASDFEVTIAREGSDPVLVVGFLANAAAGGGTLPFEIDYEGVRAVVAPALAAVLPWAETDLHLVDGGGLELRVAYS